MSYVTKVLIQSLQLLLTLVKMETQSHILMQVSNAFAAAANGTLYFVEVHHMTNDPRCCSLFPRILQACLALPWPGWCASCVAAD